VKNTIYLFLLLLNACDSPLRHMKPENKIFDLRPQIIDLSEETVQSHLTGQTINTNSTAFSAVEINWITGPTPNPNSMSHLEIYFLDKELNIIEVPMDYKLYIQGDMGMAHGLASTGAFYNEDSISWINDTLSFHMSGDYLMTLSVYDKDFNLIGEAKWRVQF